MPMEYVYPTPGITGLEDAYDYRTEVPVFPTHSQVHTRHLSGHQAPGLHAGRQARPCLLGTMEGDHANVSNEHNTTFSDMHYKENK